MSAYKAARHGSQEKSDAARGGKKRGFYNPNWKKGPPAPRGSAYKPIARPSAQQLAIFAHFAKSDKSLVVNALAGVGKTATVVEAMTVYARPGKTIAYFIFANRNAREAESKCNASIEVKTCHAFGLSILRKGLGLKADCVDAHDEKSRAIAQALLGPEDEKLELRYHFCKAMSLAKGYLCDTVEQIRDVCEKHEVEFCTLSPEDFCARVGEGLNLSAKQYQRVNFDDMIWLPIRLGLAIPKFDIVVADECQDLNPARRALILAAIGWKLLAVGDENQAIFGFTGADSDGMRLIQEATDADTLSLTTTYRCGKAIVEKAREIVPEYTAHESNPEGYVLDIGEDDMMKVSGAKPGDFILSRTNAPLVKTCLQFVKEGRRATVQGKDLGKNITYMIKRSGAVSVDAFLSWLADWEADSCNQLVKRNKPCDHITDKAECLRVFCEGTRDLETVKKRIEDMFSDEKPGEPDTASIVLSTVHKAKGLERDRVWVLLDTFKCSGPDESHVWYVAITRSRTHLMLVSKVAAAPTEENEDTE